MRRDEVRRVVAAAVVLADDVISSGGPWLAAELADVAIADQDLAAHTKPVVVVAALGPGPALLLA